jgi:hypothetical protein
MELGALTLAPIGNFFRYKKLQHEFGCDLIIGIKSPITHTPLNNGQVAKHKTEEVMTFVKYIFQILFRQQQQQEDG